MKTTYTEPNYEVSREGTDIIIRSPKGEKRLNVNCGSIEEKVPGFLESAIRKAGMNPADFFTFNATPIRKGALEFVRAEIAAGRAEMEANLTPEQHSAQWTERNRGVMQSVSRAGDINKFAKGGAL